MSVIERSTISPRLEDRWERIQIALCIALVALGTSIATTLMNSSPLLEHIGVAGANSISLKASISKQIAATLAFSAIGLTAQRRRVIWRTLKGEIKPSRTDEVQNRGQFGIKFTILLPFAAAQMAAAAFLVLRDEYGTWPSGWLALAALGLTSGYGAGKLSFTFWNYMARRGARETEEVFDSAIKALFFMATLLFLALHTKEYPLRSVRLAIRRQIYFAAHAVETNGTPVRYTWRTEKALRSSIKEIHARIAALIHDHARALAKAHTEVEYKKVCDSMLSGLMAALEEDTEGLLANAPELTRSSRISRIALHISPAAAMALFAGIIPLLPGVGDAAGSVRIFLLATAALTLIPGSNSARATIEDALNKALPGQQKP